MHLAIPILSILVHILYAQNHPPSYPIDDIATLHTVAVARFIAMQVGATVGSHCNEGTQSVQSIIDALNCNLMYEI